MKNILLYIQKTVPAILLLVTTSCKKLIEVKDPETKVVSDQVFANDETATSAILGLYSQAMRTNMLFLDGAMSLYPGLSSDELSRTSASSNDDPYFTSNIPITQSNLRNNLWKSAYGYIYQTNAILEGLAASKGVTPSIVQQIRGEAKFTRALCFFYLVNLFGDVPLILTTDYQTNATLPRTASSDVYHQITTDLSDAVNDLSATYAAPAGYPGTKVRPNKWAAAALLARVSLFQQDWQTAEVQSTAVIGSGIYNLPTDLTTVFLATSPEAIWQLAPVQASFNTAEGNAFIPTTSTAKPTYIISSGLISAFDPTDKRKQTWTQSRVVSGQTYYYPTKYKTRTGGAPYSEYNVVLRLAEQYLIRAEARAKLNTNLPGAISDVNMIRNRAGLTPLSPLSTQTDILNAITQERRVELFAEWGHRWFDLKRWGTADAVLAPIKGANWQTTDKLYPIPYAEIQLNQTLTQNPGY